MSNTWKQVPDYPNYEVSDEGQVRSKVTQRVLKPAIIRGYERVNLSKNGIPKQFFVHRLVFSAFHPRTRISNDHDLHHIDGNPTNNQLSNLKRVLRKDHPRSVPGVKYKKCGCEKVKGIRQAHETGIHTYTQIASQYGVSFDTVSKIVNRRSHKKC